MKFSLLATQGRLRKKTRLAVALKFLVTTQAEYQGQWKDDVGGKLSQWSSVGKVNKRLQW